MSFRVEELHWSTLKHIAKSPAHLRASVEQPSEPTAAMRFGTLVHSVALGGDYIVWPGERRGKAWAEFELAHEGRLIVTQNEIERAKRVADAVLSDPVAAPLLDAPREVSWKKNLHGRPCAGRADILGDGYVADLKTTACAEPDTFRRYALKMAYHGQLAFYRDALLAGRGRALLIAVETTLPYAVTVLELTERCLLEGAKQNRLWLERLAACEEADHWPGYVQSAIELDVVEDGNILVFGDEEAAE